MSDLFDKAEDAANSDQGEKITDSALDRGADAAGKASGGKGDDAIDKARDAGDSRIGNE